MVSCGVNRACAGSTRPSAWMTRSFRPIRPSLWAGRASGVLGRQVRFNAAGLLDSIQTTFSHSVDATDAAPLGVAGRAHAVRGGNGRRPYPGWKHSGAKPLSHSTGAIVWEASGQADGLEVLCHAKLECDGYINYKVTLRAAQARRPEGHPAGDPAPARGGELHDGHGLQGRLSPRRLAMEMGRHPRQFTALDRRRQCRA